MAVASLRSFYIGCGRLPHISEHTPAILPLLALTYLALRFQHIARCFNIRITPGTQTQQGDFESFLRKTSIDTERCCDHDAVWFGLHLLDSFRWIWLVWSPLKALNLAEKAMTKLTNNLDPSLESQTWNQTVSGKHSRTWSNQMFSFPSRGRHKYSKLYFDNWPNMASCTYEVRCTLHVCIHFYIVVFVKVCVRVGVCLLYPELCYKDSDLVFAIGAILKGMPTVRQQ